MTSAFSKSADQESNNNKAALPTKQPGGISLMWCIQRRAKCRGGTQRRESSLLVTKAAHQHNKHRTEDSFCTPLPQHRASPAWLFTPHCSQVLGGYSTALIWRDSLFRSMLLITFSPPLALKFRCFPSPSSEPHHFWSTAPHWKHTQFVFKCSQAIQLSALSISWVATTMVFFLIISY